MSEQLPKDLGATANRLLVIAVLLAIVGTGVIVLVYGPLTSARVGKPPKPWRLPLFWHRLPIIGRR